jgi:hypothetical protein
MAYVCNEVEIGSSGNIPETMVKWEGSPIPVPYMYFRNSSMHVTAHFCGPDDLMNELWNDIVNCAVAAGAAAGLAAIVASPAAAMPAFQASFEAGISASIGEKAGELQLSLGVEQKEDEDWHR